MADKVFINGLAAVHKGSAGKSIAFPDVCLCPPSPPAGPIPTPLPNTVQAMDLDGAAQSVLIDGNPSGKKTSFFKKSTGNEVSQPTGGGVITHAVQGKAYFVTCSPNVMFEGEPAVRHMDLLTHNHMGPQPGNTPPSPWLSTMSLPPVIPTSSKKNLRQGSSWIRVALVDDGGQPLSYVPYRLKLANGRVTSGRTLVDGGLSLQGIPTGKCELTFPEHDSRGWKGARAGAPGAKSTREVRQGDSCSLIAWAAGFADWQAVWNAPENAALRAERNNPEVLLEGDRIVLPAKAPATFSFDAGAEHKITVTRPQHRLHVVLEDDLGHPWRGCAYELRVPAQPAFAVVNGKTDGQGLLDVIVPIDAKVLHVRVWRDDEEVGESGDGKGKVGDLIYICMGYLDPIETVTGVQGRLDNLGFRCGRENGEWGRASDLALAHFQRTYSIKEEGVGPATRAKLVELCGK